MTRKTAHKIMWCLSVLYGATVGVMGAFSGPVTIFAGAGAIALGLGWTVSSMFTKGSASRQ